MVEIYYAWKTPFVDEDGNKRLVTPWADPMVYEYPFDFLFDTPEKAIDFLKDHDIAWKYAELEGWELVKVTQEPIATAPKYEEDDA